MTYENKKTHGLRHSRKWDSFTLTGIKLNLVRVRPYQIWSQGTISIAWHFAFSHFQLSSTSKLYLLHFVKCMIKRVGLFYFMILIFVEFDIQVYKYPYRSVVCMFLFVLWNVLDSGRGIHVWRTWILTYFFFFVYKCNDGISW